MNSLRLFKNQFAIVSFLCIVLFVSCKDSSTKVVNTIDESPDTTHVVEDHEVNEIPINQDLLVLEAEYVVMLSQIASLKSSNSKMYWFIVSWLKTAYRIPDWTGYYSEEWKSTAKQSGIDCSGFTRVMLDQVFDKQVAGGSQGLLDNYCTSIGLSSLEMGDLVFFIAPYSTTNKIVHVGVFVQDNYFVHATSTKSAAKGFGLAVNSIQEENWAKEFISGGKVKD